MVGLIGSAVVLLPFFFVAAVLKVGNLGNDGFKLGTSLSTCSNDPHPVLQPDNGVIRNLFLHGVPTAAFIHLVAAFFLLLPKTIMDGQLIANGLIPKDEMWKTDLDFLVPYNDRLIIFNHNTPSTRLPDVVVDHSHLTTTPLVTSPQLSTTVRTTHIPTTTTTVTTPLSTTKMIKTLPTDPQIYDDEDFGTEPITEVFTDPFTELVTELPIVRFSTPSSPVNIKDHYTSTKLVPTDMEKLITSRENTFGEIENDTEMSHPKWVKKFDLSSYLKPSESETISTDVEVIPTHPLFTYEESDTEESIRETETEDLEVDQNEYEFPTETEEKPSRPPPNIYIHTEMYDDEEINPTVTYIESHVNKSKNVYNQETELEETVYSSEIDIKFEEDNETDSDKSDKASESGDYISSSYAEIDIDLAKSEEYDVKSTEVILTEPDPKIEKVWPDLTKSEDYDIKSTEVIFTEPNPKVDTVWPYIRPEEPNRFPLEPQPLTQRPHIEPSTTHKPPVDSETESTFMNKDKKDFKADQDEDMESKYAYGSIKEFHHEPSFTYTDGLRPSVPTPVKELVDEDSHVYGVQVFNQAPGDKKKGRISWLQEGIRGFGGNRKAFKKLKNPSK
ncbi:unnamed protein product, partial [Meganyctiphanes norvegica]